jgi:phosphoribosylpyrophosphate synthetase
MFNLGIVGSRTYTNYQEFTNIVMSIVDHVGEDVRIVSGGAAGTDTFAERFAAAYNLPIKIFAPDWKTYGRGAGVVRNKTIVQNSDMILVFWDGVSKGTENTIGLAKLQRKPAIIFDIATKTIRDAGFIVDDKSGELFITLDNFGFMDLSFGRLDGKPFETTVSGFTVYSAYQIKQHSSLAVDMLKAVKGMPEAKYKINHESYDEFIEHTSEKMIRHLPQQVKMVCGISSASRLTSDFGDAVARHYQTKFIPNFFIIDKTIQLSESAPDFVMDKFQTKHFESMKQIPGRFRKFFVVSVKIAGRNKVINLDPQHTIVVVDDILTSGTTMGSAASKLEEIVDCNVVGITIFKVR